MKFKDWTIDELINYLQNIKSSGGLDYRCVIRSRGTIELYNGEKKSEKPIDK